VLCKHLGKLVQAIGGVINASAGPELTAESSATVAKHASQEGKPVTIQLINPEGHLAPRTYSQVAVATGTRMVFIAGQEPEDTVTGALIGPGDLAAQARQVFANLGAALAAAGARPDQVAKITIYVVNHRPEDLDVIEEARAGLFGGHKPPDTLVGVQSLAQPGFLIEVDAIAVIDG
jgi:enamine deaminase RidA (YjgF/YER057c/UK114 family)